MAGTYFDNITEYCCAVTDFTPTIATVSTLETHTFTADVGTNGALAFDHAEVRATDFAGNDVAAVNATGVYPSLTVDITWPAAAGNYTVYVDFIFNDGAPNCTVQLAGEVVVS